MYHVPFEKNPLKNLSTRDQNPKKSNPTNMPRVPPIDPINPKVLITKYSSFRVMVPGSSNSYDK